MDVDPQLLVTSIPQNSPPTWDYDCFLSYSTGADYKLAMGLEDFLQGFYDLEGLKQFGLKALKVCTDGSDFRLPRKKRPILEQSSSDLEEIKETIRPYLKASAELLVLWPGRNLASAFMDWELSEFMAQNEENGWDRPVWLAVSRGEEPAADAAAFFSVQQLELGLAAKVFFDFRGADAKAAPGWKKVREFEQERVRLAAQLLGEITFEGKVTEMDVLFPAYQRAKLAAARRARRNARLVAGGMTLLTAAAGWEWKQAEERKTEALAAKAEAEREKHEAEMRLAESFMAQGDARAAQDRWGDAKDLFSQARTLFRGLGISPYSTDLALFDAYRHAPLPLLEIGSGDSPISASASLPNDCMLVFTAPPSSRSESNSSREGMLAVWDVHAGLKLNESTGFQTGVEELAVDRAGAVALLAASWPRGDGDTPRINEVELWDLASKKLATKWSKTDFYSSGGIAISPDGEHWVTPHLEIGSVFGSGSSIPLLGSEEPPTVIAFSEEGSNILSGGRYGIVDVWNTESGRLERRLDAKSENILTSVAESKGIIAAGYGDCRVRLWNLSDDKNRVFSGHSNRITSVAFSLEGPAMLASGSQDHTCRLWALDSEGRDAVLTGHTSSVQQVCFKNEKILVSIAADGMKSWPASGGGEMKSALGNRNSVFRVSFSPDLELAVSAGEDGSCRLWDIATGKQIAMLSEFKDGCAGASFENDGRHVLASGLGEAILLDLEHGKKIKISDDSLYLQRIPDETKIIGWGESGVFSFDANSGAPIQKFDDYPNSKEDSVLVAPAFTPRTREVAGASYKGIHFWNIDTGKIVGKYPIQMSEGIRKEANITSLAISDDGKTAATGGGDKLIRIWDLTKEGAAPRVLAAHSGLVSQVAFARNSSILVSSSFDGTINIWNVKTGKVLRTLDGHSGRLITADVSRDGSLLASGGENGNIYFWDLKRPEKYEEFAVRMAEAKKKQAVNSKDPEVKKTFGEWYLFRGVYRWALEDLLAAQAGGAKISHLDLARCYWQLDRLQEAGNEFEKELEEATDDDQKFYLRMCLKTVRQEG